MIREIMMLIMTIAGVLGASGDRQIDDAGYRGGDVN